MRDFDNHFFLVIVIVIVVAAVIISILFFSFLQLMRQALSSNIIKTKIKKIKTKLT